MKPKKSLIVNLFAMLVLAIGVGLFAQESAIVSKDSGTTAVEAGLAALSQNSYEQARSEFEKGLEAVRRQGNRAQESDLLFYLGLTEQRQAIALSFTNSERRRLLERAARLYSNALSIKSPLEQPVAPTLNNLGRVYADLGEYDDADTVLRRAIQVSRDDPRRPAYFKSYAQLLVETGRWQEAASWYRSALEAWPEDIGAHEALVSLYSEREPEALPGYLWWLATRGQVNRAQEGALTALQSKRFNEQTGAWLLGVVAGTLAEQYGEPVQFWEGIVWKTLAPLAADKQIGPGIREIARLYTAQDFQAATYIWWRGHRLPPPRQGLEPLRAFRRLAVALGKWYEHGIGPTGFPIAEGYFKLANSLSSTKADPLALQALADLYVQHNRMSELDQISGKSLDFVDAMEAKNDHIEEWGAVFDFHRELGLVYSSEGRWGDGSTPASAIFQLERARSIAKQYNTSRPSGAKPLALSSEFLGLLAQGYEETGRIDDARRVRAEATGGEYANLRTEVLEPVKPEEGEGVELTAVLSFIQGNITINKKYSARDMVGHDLRPLMLDGRLLEVVREGDEIRIPAGSRANLVCSNNHLVTLIQGIGIRLTKDLCLEGIALPLEAYKGLAPVGGRIESVKGVFYVGETTGAQSDEYFGAPILLSPRNTALFGPRPEISWTAVRGATEYELDLVGPTSFRLRLEASELRCTNEGSVCSIPWPASVADLSFGEVAFLSIGARYGLASPLRVESGPSRIQRLTEWQEGELRLRLNQLRNLPLEYETRKLLEANAFAQAGAFSEAIRAYQEVLALRDVPEIGITLGDAYFTVNLLLYAGQRYQDALARSSEPAVQAGAEFGLAKVEYARGNFYIALEKFRRAGLLYSKLGLVDKYIASNFGIEKVERKTRSQENGSQQ